MSSGSGLVLELKQLRLRYPSSDRWTLDGLDLELEPGERLALVGPSGCGKSTVARAVLQLLPAGSQCLGGLKLQGQDPRTLGRSALRQLRGEAVGLVFQDPMTRLNPLMTVGNHLLDTLRAHRPATPSTKRRNRAEQLLEAVGIGAERFGAYPHEFSGGMRQRLAIALAMALDPPLVIADEPTTSLDVAVANQVMGALQTLCAERGSALLLISHDLAMANRWCERMAVLDQGRVAELNSSLTVLTEPRSDVGQRLVAAARQREGGQTPAAPESRLLLRVENLRCWHNLGGPPWAPHWLKAVDGVSFALQAGESLGVVGGSGCGKSTLCRALMGLNPIRGGQVWLNGQELLRLRGPQEQLARRSIQMVFQDPLACLNPAMRVVDAIADPLLIHGLAKPAAARERARELLELVGLTPAEEFQNRRPRQLSGGQQQRVAIARALALDPRVLICDESVSMLDAEIQAEVLMLLRGLQARLGVAMLFITHDLSVASGFCHRVIVLDKGKIVEEGRGDQVLQAPEAAITRKLVAACPRLPAA
ncbi:ABC transporter ATP-binding protein [Synechococcus sp. BS55D]|uniref:ABC transporter ATP-binding protein n=1 Tax=Synechococcus sp. BS55D TaxID=2055943 RepID=UPI00103A9FA6|nr:ABC transporter ATP-binding protein [Synechococcus sp. BS55D]TCD58348.1 ABC transporter ATP-binding protein [Synechococcus sp. BS55D]